MSVRTRAALTAAVDARWRVLADGRLAVVDTAVLRAQVWRNGVTGLWEWDTLTPSPEPVGGWRGSSSTPSGAAADARTAVSAAELALSEAAAAVSLNRRGGGAW